jgi:hypothetical protein
MIESYRYILGFIVVGFLVYLLVKDKIFDNEYKTNETFETPAPASIEIRQAPIYPERVVASSGPNSPNQEPPGNEVVVYADPKPADPYSEPNQSSEIPEDLRYPERSFRAPPLNNQTQISVESGVSSHTMQVNSDNSQRFSTDFLQNGGEFMKGVFANDTFDDVNYSAF